MGFRDLELKPAYDSDEDDVLNGFYIPVLSEAVKYRRLAGYFSSAVLAVVAHGMYNFIQNGGEMEMVVGAKLSVEDVEAIRRGSMDPTKAAAASLIKELDSIEQEFVRDHVKALAWMVARGKLAIKVAIPLDSDGSPMDYSTGENRGIFHQKVGILVDDMKDVVSFSGSINETASGWLHNVEEFKVFRSWVDGERQHLESDVERVHRFWDGLSKNTLVTDVPRAVQDKLLELAPAKFEDLQLAKYQRRSIKLRDYQDKATDAWFVKGRGFLEMATGTGKTFAALACLEKVRQKEKRLTVVVTVPFIHLVTQWVKALSEWGLRGLPAHGSSEVWRTKVMNEILDVNNGYTNLLILVTTHDTFSNPKFNEIISKANSKKMLIADEVHGLGSEQRKEMLAEDYEYRLGLSATPARWLDDPGTESLEKYFGNTVFEFSLKDAIRAGFLVPYEYYPHFVEMTPEELEEYRDYSKKLVRQFYAAKEDSAKSEVFELLAILRQRIVVNAKNKLTEFRRLLDMISPIAYCLVYCSPEQIKEVQSILNDRGIIQHKFTAVENREERDLLLKRFADGTYEALVAMRCLDEGVDVPPTRMGIFLASSGNPKQFIQRRGRILRKFEGKRVATIHDVVVVPTIERQIDPEFFKMEQRILRRELNRLREFADASKNPAYTISAMLPILDRYEMSLGEAGVV